MSLETVTRREFFKQMVGKGTSLAVGAAVAGSTILSFAGLGIAVKTETNELNNPPSDKEKADIKDTKLVLDRSIKNINFKLYGVQHKRAFGEANISEINELIKESYAVISEGVPGAYYGKDAKKYENSYFGIIARLCRENNKSIIYLDPQSFAGFSVELLSGLAGGWYAIANSRKIIHKHSTRRDFFSNSIKTIGGLYFFTSSLYLGTPLKFIMGRKDNENIINNEKFFLSHLIDQRNVEIASRLLSLPERINKDELRGRYIFGTFGMAHVIGVNYYLNNPTLRRIKSAIYALNYGLLDSDEISKYTPQPDGTWQKTPLVIK